MKRELDFERPILAIERQIEALRRAAAGRDRLANVVATNASPAGPPSRTGTPRQRRASKERASAAAVRAALRLDAQIEKLERRASALRTQIFRRLSRWQVVQVARHPERPFTLDYVGLVFSDFVELRGDRCFGDDRAIVGGLARLGNEAVLVIGHQKGRTTRENVTRNFGMPRPEGYRKALRLMRLAERFRLPIITLVDTPGAYPGLDAEERGQAQAIAEALEGMAALEVPVISVIIGEGGSGGALAIAVSNRVLMFRYAVYSVNSPEGCASILFKDALQAERAADALKLTAPDLLALGIVDRVIAEPEGGAHRDRAASAANLREALMSELFALKRLDPSALREQRYRRFRVLGDLESKTVPIADALPMTESPAVAEAPQLSSSAAQRGKNGRRSTGRRSKVRSGARGQSAQPHRKPEPKTKPGRSSGAATQGGTRPTTSKNRRDHPRRPKADEATDAKRQKRTAAARGSGRKGRS